ncbi:MAG: hypothetical protein LBF15_06200 [Candidatus Peribacteria bacterium]|nr:hypothetical protein [Candidatus Peribacteria bacterium]
MFQNFKAINHLTKLLNKSPKTTVDEAKENEEPKAESAQGENNLDINSTTKITKANLNAGAISNEFLNQSFDFFISFPFDFL